MDRKSNKKIAVYIVIVCFMIGIIGSGITLLMERTDAVYDRQQTELTILHPELEQEITENIQYYHDNMKRILLQSYIAVLLLFLSFVSLCLLLQRHRQKQIRKELSMELQQLAEQMEQLRNKEKLLLPLEYGYRSSGMYEPELNRLTEALFELTAFFLAQNEKIEAEEKNTKALITDISHQLKTPLASLKLSHDLVQEDKITQKQRCEFLEQEEAEIDKLEFLLNELMKLSRLENHMIQIKPVKTSIVETITEAVNQVIMKACSKSITIQVEKETDYMADHDSKWTAEAISNLLDNAIKYSGTGTTIIIRIQKLTTHLLLEVEDEGIGISDTELHKIFQRFYRGEQAAKLVKEGTGIGLYLTRRILEEQGGTITAKAKLKSGSIFRITLPL